MKLNLLLALVIGLALTSGCQKTGSAVLPVYEFKSETRQNIVELRATLKSDDISDVSLQTGYGVIDWMADEGRMVASGEVILKIDMEEETRRMRGRVKDLASQMDRKATLDVAGPAEIADLNKTLSEKRLDLALAAMEDSWLRHSKTVDEIWKINSDLQVASISFQHASQVYSLKKNVTEKGFDSPFSLRTSEIDMRSKEIELDYARRIKNKLSEPPLPEELARLDYQRAVASGEIWLAQNQLEVASITTQIKSKNFEVVVERINSSIREMQKSLDERVLFAPRAGIVIHPVVWGDYRFKPGAQAWSGVTIVQVIGNGKFFLETIAAEADANLIVEKASATIEFDALPGQIFNGEIKSISKSPSSNKGPGNSKMHFFPVTIACDLKNPLLIGLKARVSVILSTQTGVFMPRETLIKKGEDYMFKIRGTFGDSLQKAEIEDFNQDWVIWKNAAASQGVVLYP